MFQHVFNIGPFCLTVGSSVALCPVTAITIGRIGMAGYPTSETWKEECSGPSLSRGTWRWKNEYIPGYILDINGASCRTFCGHVVKQWFVFWRHVPSFIILLTQEEWRIWTGGWTTGLLFSCWHRTVKVPSFPHRLLEEQKRGAEILWEWELGRSMTLVGAEAEDSGRRKGWMGT